MSRFFRQAGDSDSDTEESEEELMSSDDEAPSKPAPSKPTGMSRFLKGAGSSSSSSSESESEEDSDEDESDSDKDVKKKSRFLVGADGDDESDEDVKRTVPKSAKDKRIDEMEAVGKTMENALKINDWVAISNGACQRFLHSYGVLKRELHQNSTSFCVWLSVRRI